MTALSNARSGYGFLPGGRRWKYHSTKVEWPPTCTEAPIISSAGAAQRLLECWRAPNRRPKRAPSQADADAAPPQPAPPSPALLFLWVRCRRAVLGYVEQIAHGGDVDDPTFAALEKFFTICKTDLRLFCRLEVAFIHFLNTPLLIATTGYKSVFFTSEIKHSPGASPETRRTDRGLGQNPGHFDAVGRRQGDFARSGARSALVRGAASRCAQGADL